MCKGGDDGCAEFACDWNPFFDSWAGEPNDLLWDGLCSTCGIVSTYRHC